MASRLNFRPRPLDVSKQLQIVTDKDELDPPSEGGKDIMWTIEVRHPVDWRSELSFHTRLPCTAVTDSAFLSLFSFILLSCSMQRNKVPACLSQNKLCLQRKMCLAITSTTSLVPLLTQLRPTLNPTATLQVKEAEAKNPKRRSEIPIPTVSNVDTYARDYLPTFQRQPTYIRGRGLSFEPNHFAASSSLELELERQILQSCPQVL